MGITYLDAVAYRTAKLRGTSFERTMTLGHQNIYLHRQEVRALRKQYRAQCGAPPMSLENYEWGDFADSFLRDFLEISNLSVLDNSTYEGATTIHDMNEPVPDEWHNQFDAIIDCGSLEHIFNVPVALRNLASMLTVGGSLFITTPANNLMGHGFYQFSPELMFRVFSEDNGFVTRNLTLRQGVFPAVESTRSRRLYSVADPQDVHKRVGLMSKRPTTMFVEAIKIAQVDVLAKSPYQSDYVTAWTSDYVAPPKKSVTRRAASRMLAALPRTVSAQYYGRREMRQFSLSNKEFYKRLPIANLQ